MPRVESFDPVVGTDPKILILGSMPGVKSLQAQQYYAHPRNAFWPIMAELFEVTWVEDYAGRIQQLRQLPVVLWDVLGSCHRQGSLDAAIESDRIEVNRIDRLLSRYPNIELIAFNGAAAEKYFQHKVAGSIPGLQQKTLRRMPSTSPAHASMSFQQKLEKWRSLMAFLD